MNSTKKDGTGEFSPPLCGRMGRARAHTPCQAKAFSVLKAQKYKVQCDSQTKARFSGIRKRANTGVDTQTNERAVARLGGWGAATGGVRLRRKTLCRWGVL